MKEQNPTPQTSEPNTPAPPVDIWEVAESLWRENEDSLGLPRSAGPLDKNIEEKLARFDGWDAITYAALAAMEPIILIEKFLSANFGMSGLFRGRSDDDK